MDINEYEVSVYRTIVQSGQEFSTLAMLHFKYVFKYLHISTVMYLTQQKSVLELGEYVIQFSNMAVKQEEPYNTRLGQIRDSCIKNR